MLISIICCIVCSLLFIFIGKYVFKPDMSKLMTLDTSKLDQDGTLVLNKIQKIVLCFLFALVIMLLIPSFLPKSFFLTKFLSAIGNTGICIFLVTVMCCIKVDGKPLLPFKKMVDSGVTWGIILLLALFVVFKFSVFFQVLKQEASQCDCNKCNCQPGY